MEREMVMEFLAGQTARGVKEPGRMERRKMLSSMEEMVKMRLFHLKTKKS